MLTEPGLNTLQQKEIEELIEKAIAPLREEIDRLRRQLYGVSISETRV